MFNQTALPDPKSAERAERQMSGFIPGRVAQGGAAAQAQIPLKWEDRHET